MCTQTNYLHILWCIQAQTEQTNNCFGMDCIFCWSIPLKGKYFSLWVVPGCDQHPLHSSVGSWSTDYCNASFCSWVSMATPSWTPTTATSSHTQTCVPWYVELCIWEPLLAWTQGLWVLLLIPLGFLSCEGHQLWHTGTQEQEGQLASMLRCPAWDDFTFQTDSGQPRSTCYKL